MTKPRLTAIIDTYNHERFVEEAIVSVLEQDFPRAEMEVIVVDDGSTDRTPEIVRKFEPRVRLLRKANGGQASAFNAGIPEARGEFLSFLDGDDWWARNKLTLAMKAFEAEPHLGLVGHGNILVYPDGHFLQEVLREGFRFQAKTAEGARLFRLRKSFLGTCRMVIRAGLMRRILPVPEELRIQADEFLFTLAAVLEPVAILPEPLLFYRIHGGNNFQLSSADPGLARRKQAILAHIARTLSVRLREMGVSEQVHSILVEILQAEALQMRLMQDGGWPWETVKTERKIYEVMHPDAPVSHRVFKVANLLPAMVLPPKVYYGIRGRLSKSRLYLRARKRWLPVPEPRHVEKIWKEG